MERATGLAGQVDRPPLLGLGPYGKTGLRVLSPSMSERMIGIDGHRLGDELRRSRRRPILIGAAKLGILDI
jgi:hypothetical protein